MELIRNIQAEIREESKRLSNENWSKNIQELNEIYREPSKFWRDVNRLMGNNNPRAPYILDNQRNKISDPKGKEKKFREIWTDIFRITRRKCQL